MKKIYLLFLVVSILFTGCKKEQQAVIPPQPFEVYEIKTKTVPIYQEFVGQIYGEKDIPIRARVVGFLDGIHFREGEKVHKGQLLYSIDPDPLLQEVAAQRSMMAQAESDLKRIEPLAALSAVSEQELSMATSQRDAAASGLEAAKANLKLAELNLGYAKMYAP